MSSTVTVSELRQNLAQHLDATAASRAPLTVIRPAGRGDLVILSADEYEGMIETLHLLRSPRNAGRLMHSIAQADAGGATERL
jgi:antitoxin YefM